MDNTICEMTRTRNKLDTGKVGQRARSLQQLNPPSAPFHVHLEDFEIRRDQEYIGKHAIELVYTLYTTIDTYKLWFTITYFNICAST